MATKGNKSKEVEKKKSRKKVKRNEDFQPDINFENDLESGDNPEERERMASQFSAQCMVLSAQK